MLTGARPDVTATNAAPQPQPALPADYEYDVFISYPRQHLSGRWLHALFLAEFTQRLGDTLPDEPRVFCDKNDIAPGLEWRAELQRALRCSRSMVAIWSPEYFRRAWCCSEWRSFRKRGRGLVVPLQWSLKPQLFPADAQSVQMIDFSPYAFDGEAFANSNDGLALRKEIRKLAEEVARVLNRAPPFNSTDPAFEPEMFPADLGRAKIQLVPLGGAALSV